MMKGDSGDVDVVNRPRHYQSESGLECIDSIKAQLTPEQYKGFLKGTALAYLWRAPHKGTESLDYQKAEWYLKRLMRETVLADCAPSSGETSETGSTWQVTVDLKAARKDEKRALLIEAKGLGMDTRKLWRLPPGEIRQSIDAHKAQGVQG